MKLENEEQIKVQVSKSSQFLKKLRDKVKEIENRKYIEKNSWDQELLLWDNKNHKPLNIRKNSHSGKKTEITNIRNQKSHYRYRKYYYRY